jgi:hypothetical protein
MTIPATNSKLLVTEDWKKLYQSFPNAEFQSYDFDTIRRTLISYLQENYPEDFNDFIDSSEYIALVDLISTLGQNLSFRIDLNARENFLGTAQRRTSILQLAQLISYSPSRNVPASGLLKISAIATTGNVTDSNGVNLANSTVSWNDPTNTNWYNQFMSIMNSAMPAGTAFGNPNSRATLGGILTEQYILNSANTDVPIYSFTQNINGTSMNFEVVPAAFDGKTYIYEGTPKPGSPISLIYQNDNQGAASPNTGFFALFKQGSIAVTSFDIKNPVPNEIIGINVSNINKTDVWLWQLDATNRYSNLWQQVPALVGNNVIYNSVNQAVRNIYSVTTRDQDQIDLNFADGSFGNLPSGNFQLFYRQSNGLNYTIKPIQMSGVLVKVPYVDQVGQNQTLTMVLTLEYTVNNSAPTESIASIKQNAPQSYYTQNRMVTGEDYNIAPLTYTTNVVKVKSVSRISSGISKYFDLSDVSGKYSSTNIFCDDGTISKHTTSTGFTFSFVSSNDIQSVFNQTLAPLIDSTALRSFYFDQYRTYRPITIDFATFNLSWVTVNTVTGQSRGYFKNPIPQAVGPIFASLPNPLVYVTAGAMIKFRAPNTIAGDQQYFLPDGTITATKTYNAVSYIWTTVKQVIGTGSNNGLGPLNDGTGPIIFNNTISSNAIPIEIIPVYENNLTYTFQSSILNLCLSQQSFGLSIDSVTRSWRIIEGSNLDASYNTGDMFENEFAMSNSGNDASWLVKFNWDSGANAYNVTIKNTKYIFKSNGQTGFFLDKSSVNFDYKTNTVIKDKISVLSVNPDITGSGSSYPADYSWQIDDVVVEADQYVDPTQVVVSLYDHLDSQHFSQLTDPDSFNNVVGVGNTSRSGLKFQYIHNSGQNTRIDPAKSNIIDIYMLTADYNAAFRNWLLTGIGSKPVPPTSQSLENNYSADLEPIKTISDQIIYQPATYKILFGSKASPNLQATFKAVINNSSTLSNNAIISQILQGINNFFALENWDFGQSFYFSELSTYIMNLMTPDITNFLIVPNSGSFGDLYEVACLSNEIFISGATAANIQIITAATAAQLTIAGK